MPEENNNLHIDHDGKIYRCVRRPDSESDFGKWDFLYNGKWHECISYSVRSQLNKLLNQTKQHEQTRI